MEVETIPDNSSVCVQTDAGIRRKVYICIAVCAVNNSRPTFNVLFCSHTDMPI